MLELDFFFMAQGSDLLVNGENKQSQGLFTSFSSQDCQFNQNIYKRVIPLLKEVLVTAMEQVKRT